LFDVVQVRHGDWHVIIGNCYRLVIVIVPRSFAAAAVWLMIQASTAGAKGWPVRYICHWSGPVDVGRSGELRRRRNTLQKYQDCSFGRIISHAGKL